MNRNDCPSSYCNYCNKHSKEEKVKMRIDIAPEKIKKIMRRMSAVSSGRTAMPVLSSTKIDGFRDSTRFTATDLEMDIVIEDTKTAAAEEGTVCLDTALLRKIVEKEKGFEISIKSDGNGATLKSSGNTKINGYDPKEFPQVDSDIDEAAEKITIEPEKLAFAIQNTLHATAHEDDVPVLSGVCIEEKDGQLVVAATNSFNLALCEIRPDVILLDGIHVIPKKFLQVLLPELAGVGHYHVTLEIRKSSIKAILADGYIRSRLISGDYPKYENVLPDREDMDIVCDIDRKALLQKVDQCMLFGDTIDMHIENQVVTLTSKGDEGMTEQSISADVHIDKNQEKFANALNAKYLRQFLCNATGETITMGLTKPLKPILLWSDEDEGYQHLVMPIKRMEA